MKTSLAWVTLITTACCGSDPKKMPDAPPDISFMGEYVDWDSTDNTFCGINKATFTVRGDASRTDLTNPNGRFTLAIPGGTANALVDITPPTGPSECLPSMSTYSMPGIFVADPAVLATMQILSTRNFSAARMPTLGFTPDAGKGHVFVHVDATQAPVTISTTSDTAQKFDGSAWAAGTQGVNVFFPNVAPGDVTVAMGTAIGGGTVPVEAAKITYVTFVGS